MKQPGTTPGTENSVFCGMMYHDPETAGSPTEPLNNTMAIFLNEERTMESIYKQNFPAAEKYIMLNNGTREQAKDIFQEAFIAVWRNIKLERFKPLHENSLNNYLLQVVKNKWIDHLRSTHYRKTVQLDETGFENEADILPAEQQEKIALIKTHFKNLGNVCQEVLRLFYYQKQSLRMIADTFKWTEATARNNKYRCIERLRAFITSK